MFDKVLAIYRNIKRRECAKEVSNYRLVIATPTSLGSCIAGASLTAYRLPQNAVVGISLNAVTTSSHISASISGGRTLRTSGGASAVLQKLGYLERSRTLTINRLAGCPSGTLSVWILDEWNRKKLIATGTFT